MAKTQCVGPRRVAGMLLCRSTCCLKRGVNLGRVGFGRTNRYWVLVVSSQCTLQLGIASLLTRIRTNVSIVEVAGWQRAIEMLARGDFSAAFFALADGGADAVKFITLIATVIRGFCSACSRIVESRLSVAYLMPALMATSICATGKRRLKPA